MKCVRGVTWKWKKEKKNNHLCNTCLSDSPNNFFFTSYFHQILMWLFAATLTFIGQRFASASKYQYSGRKTNFTTNQLNNGLHWPLLKLHHNIPWCSLSVTPKFCISIVFSFAWELKWSQEKLKTTLMSNFGVTKKEHYGVSWYFL